MITEEIKTKLKKTFYKPLTYKDILSSKEVYDLKKVLMSNWTETRNYKGGKILFGGFNEYLRDYLKNMLQSLYPNGIPGIDFPWDDISIWGNVYFTSGEYGIHTDAFEEHVIASGNINLKNIIIPLDVAGLNIEHPNVNNLVLMQNRLIDYDTTFQKNTNAQWKVKYQKNITDYTGLDWINVNGNSMNLDPNQQYISDSDYLNHLAHIRQRQTLDSLIIDELFKYNVGSILFHDSCQVHVTGRMQIDLNTYVSNKMGVRLALRVPINSIA